MHEYSNPVVAPLDESKNIKLHTKANEILTMIDDYEEAGLTPVPPETQEGESPDPMDMLNANIANYLSLGGSPEAARAMVQKQMMYTDVDFNDKYELSIRNSTALYALGKSLFAGVGGMFAGTKGAGAAALIFDGASKLYVKLKDMAMTDAEKKDELNRMKLERAKDVKKGLSDTDSFTEQFLLAASMSDDSELSSPVIIVNPVSTTVYDYSGEEIKGVHAAEFGSDFPTSKHYKEAVKRIETRHGKSMKEIHSENSSYRAVLHDGANASAGKSYLSGSRGPAEKAYKAAFDESMFAERKDLSEGARHKLFIHSIETEREMAELHFSKGGGLDADKEDLVKAYDAYTQERITLIENTRLALKSAKELRDSSKEAFFSESGKVTPIVPTKGGVALPQSTRNSNRKYQLMEESSAADAAYEDMKQYARSTVFSLGVPQYELLDKDTSGTEITGYIAGSIGGMAELTAALGGAGKLMALASIGAKFKRAKVVANLLSYAIKATPSSVKTAATTTTAFVKGGTKTAGAIRFALKPLSKPVPGMMEYAGYESVKKYNELAGTKGETAGAAAFAAANTYSTIWLTMSYLYGGAVPALGRFRYTRELSLAKGLSTPIGSSSRLMLTGVKRSLKGRLAGGAAGSATMAAESAVYNMYDTGTIQSEDVMMASGIGFLMGAAGALDYEFSRGVIKDLSKVARGVHEIPKTSRVYKMMNEGDVAGAAKFLYEYKNITETFLQIADAYDASLIGHTPGSPLTQIAAGRRAETMSSYSTALSKNSAARALSLLEKGELTTNLYVGLVNDVLINMGDETKLLLKAESSRDKLAKIYPQVPTHAEYAEIVKEKGFLANAVREHELVKEILTTEFVLDEVFPGQFSSSTLYNIKPFAEGVEFISAKAEEMFLKNPVLFSLKQDAILPLAKMDIDGGVQSTIDRQSGMIDLLFKEDPDILDLVRAIDTDEAALRSIDETVKTIKANKANRNNSMQGRRKGGRRR